MIKNEPVNELNRLNGALEVLGLLREKLLLQKEELAAQSAEEALDEMLSQVESLYLEYRQRRSALHPHHRSYQFFLTSNGIRRLPHDSLVELLRGEVDYSEYAGQTLRLADWYVRILDDKPQKVVNENYNWVVFDESGRVDLHAAKDIVDSPLPSKEEHRKISELLFELSS